MPKVSFLVPVYNVSAYIGRCARSLFEQTFDDIEYIFVNDCTPDDSMERLEAVIEQYPERAGQVKIINQEQNQGPGTARNVALLAASGEYVCCVDSDDYVEYNMYALLQEAIGKYGVKAAQIGRDEISQEGERLPDICVPPSSPECIEPKDFLRELLLHRGDCSFCTKLLKKEVFQGRRFPEGVLNEDFHLLVEMLPDIGSIVSLPERGYHVFCRMGSNTRRNTGFSRVFSDNVDNADMVMELVKKQYPALYKQARRFGLYQRLDYMLHIPISEMKGENQEYGRIKGYIRRYWAEGMANPFLTPQNKAYLTLLAAAPKTVRRIHKKVKRL